MSINSQKKKSPGIRETIHSEESKFKEKGGKKKRILKWLWKGKYPDKHYY